MSDVTNFSIYMYILSAGLPCCSSIMSSPNGSLIFTPPLRNRRSLSTAQLQHLRNGGGRDSLDDSLRQNDDDAEKLQRQKERLLELQRQNLSSPATPKDRRTSLGTGLSGLTNSQLAEHYEDCIRLNAENKITVKNAFVLHLIDYMAEMLKNRDEPTNFQIASCTLDASTKIYAVRVDSVHNEVFKMVGNLGMGEDQKRKKPADEDALETELPNAKKKKVKKSATIEQNLKNLNMQKLDLEYEADPLFQRMTSLFDEGGVGGLMVNTLKCLDDHCELILDSSIVPEKHLAARLLEDPTLVDKTDFQELLASVGEAKICPTFESFAFGGWSIPTEDFSQVESTVPEKRNEFAYHPVSPGQLEEEENDDGMHCDDDGFPPNDDAVEDSIFSERRAAFANTRTSGIRAVTFESLDDIAQVLADKPSDYSYFNNQLISAWAGPHHWKLRPSFKKVVGEQKEAESRKRVKKAPHVLDYSVEIDTTVKHKKSKMTKRSVMTSDIEKTTLPEDWHYAVEDLTKFMLKTNFYVKASGQISDMAIQENGANYNYDNANDCSNFCPSNEEDSENENDHGDDDNRGIGFDTVIDETCLPLEDTIFPDTQLPFTGTNLVQLPYKIDKLQIHYARTAKKIDVKKLKRIIWNILLNKDEKEVLSGSERMEGETTFGQLYAALPARLSETAAQNLSVPIAFVCFLHIVNEKNLSLKGQDDYSDFTIMQS